MAELYVYCASVLVVYLIPSFVAFFRGHPNRWMIFAANFFLGGTGFVWFVALCWSLHKIHDPKNACVGSPGGQSGLNINANDVFRVQLEGTKEHSDQSMRTPKRPSATQLQSASAFDDTEVGRNDSLPASRSRGADKSRIAQLEKLAQLYERRLLSDEEFAREKMRILSSVS